MAFNEGLRSITPNAHQMLPDLLADALPKEFAFKLYHVSTPPEKSEALYSATPGERPDKTYCESHFLAISINTGAASEDDGGEVLAFAIEVLIYSTAYSTTLFVSKADSTGYLHLLNLPRGAPSPLKKISSIFLAYLTEKRARKGIKTVVSLFARAQDQYLFPGSVENNGKHVLDDRGLVKWWCHVLDPLLRGSTNSQVWDEKAISGYLLVPGLDKYEVMQMLPSSGATINSGGGWAVGHPLKDITRYHGDIPPRSLIPHFPDDPKARFLDELDDESARSQGQSQSGHWKSVKSLDQFWEMMAFRQECSAGRMVGFIWVVFSPLSEPEPFSNDQGPSTESMSLRAADNDISEAIQASQETQSTHHDRHPSNKKKKLSGPIASRQPRIKTEHRTYAFAIPEQTAYYTWPAPSHGQIVLESKDYKRTNELLLRLDFSTLNFAKGSTRRWISEVRAEATSPMVSAFGAVISGRTELVKPDKTATSGITTLNAGVVRKKRKAGAEENTVASAQDAAVVSDSSAPKINVLGAGMVRKKAKPT